MAAAEAPVHRRIHRSLSDRLDKYCFASSFAAGLESDEESFDESYVPEYAAILQQHRMDSEKSDTVASPIEASSFWVSVANVTKSLVGIGMLTLPRAVAEAQSLPLAILGLLLCGALCAVSFFFLGYCAHLTNSETLPRLWEQTIGPSSAFFVEMVVLVDTGLSCVAFALLIGDYMAKSVSGLCPSLPPEVTSRRTLVAVVTVFALIPLCLKRRFSLLRISSIAGLMCTLYVFLYVTIDSFSFIWLTSGGSGLENLDDTPDWMGSLRSFGIYSCAFMAHFNAPAFYADLEGRTPMKFAEVCGAAYTLAFLIYAAFGLAGFARFGPSVPGNALTAYDLDTKVLLMWLGMALCVAASFPLVFFAHRDALRRLVARGLGWPLDDHRFVPMTFTVVSVLVLATAGAVLEDVSFVVSLCGACSGACLAFILPGAIMLKISGRKDSTLRWPKLAKVLISLGIILGFLSTVAVLDP